MIQNDRQYKVTQNKLRELEQSLLKLDSNQAKLTEHLLKAEKKGIQALIDRLSTEIAEYDNLKTEKRQFLQEVENAYIELANGPEYQAEIALWEVTVGDGQLGRTVALNQ